jgi:hypothetical protein
LDTPSHSILLRDAHRLLSHNEFTEKSKFFGKLGLLALFTITFGLSVGSSPCPFPDLYVYEEGKAFTEPNFGAVQVPSAFADQ